MKTKKFGIVTTLFAAILVCAAVVLFAYWFYKPPFPVESVTAKGAMAKLSQSGDDIAEIAEEKDAIWYMIKSGGQGISFADEAIKRLMESKGWIFREKNGAGLFFEKNGERLIATTQMWTRQYVLVKVESKFKSLS